MAAVGLRHSTCQRQPYFADLFPGFGGSDFMLRTRERIFGGCEHEGSGDIGISVGLGVFQLT
jgi:hypothetical protein